MTINLWKDVITGGRWIVNSDIPGINRNKFNTNHDDFTSIPALQQYTQTKQTAQNSTIEIPKLSSQLITVQEQERKRIASELHDCIGQSLSVIKYSIEGALVKFCIGKIDSGIAGIKNVIPKIQSALEEVRRIAMNLRPSVLDDIGILETIEWFCREFSSTYHDIAVYKTIEIQERNIDHNIKLTIYRIIQEAFNNIAKHAQADEICLILKKSRRHITLYIKDNGKGFSTENLSQPVQGLTGLGLRSMQERVQQDGGTFRIRSSHCNGTLILVTFPLID
jgi:signal transduction histidine kinase